MSSSKFSVAWSKFHLLDIFFAKVTAIFWRTILKRLSFSDTVPIGMGSMLSLGIDSIDFTGDSVF